tara:strand:- start:12114 stop:12803 length:690 start_codon:yes stop_codon:yes gene_type:complete
MQTAIIQSINIGKIKKLNHANGSVQSGIFKKPIKDIISITQSGIEGDHQADLKAHGGSDKVVCVYPVEHHDWWLEEFGITFVAGSAGENFTTKGLIEDTVCIGDQYQIGAAILEVSQPRQPCYKLAARHGDKSIAKKVQQAGKTGFYFRCIQEGNVQAGDELELIQRPNSEFTIEKANHLMHIDKMNIQLMQKFVNLETLSASWKKYFKKRIKTSTVDSDNYIVNPPEN